MKDEVKQKFATTLQFVEEYLSNVVNRSYSFSDKEQNKLTYEVTANKFATVQLCKRLLLFRKFVVI